MAKLRKGVSVQLVAKIVHPRAAGKCFFYKILTRACACVNLKYIDYIYIYRCDNFHADFLQFRWKQPLQGCPKNWRS